MNEERDSLRTRRSSSRLRRCRRSDRRSRRISLQALLVVCVVLWVLDVPRQAFRLAFYTEQLLTVCLGLTLALAFIGGRTQREAVALRLGRRHRRRSASPPTSSTACHRRLDIPLAADRRAWRVALAWTCRRQQGLGDALVRLDRRRAVAADLRLHHRALRAADLRARDAAARRHRRQRDPAFCWCWRRAAAPPGAASSASSWRWRSTSSSARTCRAISRRARSRRERLLVYLGLDINGMIGPILQRGRAGGDPVHHPGPGAGAHRRRGLLLRYRDVGAWAASAAAPPRSRWWARRCSA